MAKQYISIIDKVKSQLKLAGNVQRNVKQSLMWYKNKITGSRADLEKNILADPKRSREWFYPGGMYMFVYDPKHKKTLPYYDKFPLIILIGMYDDGFLGINFHYLDYKTRLTLLNKIMQIDSNAKLPKQTKIKLTYDMLVSNIPTKEFKPCVKRYLSSHVQSHAIKVEQSEWEIAIFLPVENFAKRGKTRVWEDSKLIIRGLPPKHIRGVNKAGVTVASTAGTPTVPSVNAPTSPTI